MKKLSVLAVVVVLGLSASVALALAPMGPPTAGLKAGQFGAGAEYSYTKTDLKVEWEGEDSETIKDVKLNVITSNIGYGITDDWEGFVRLGVGNAKGSEDDFGSSSGDYKFAWGLGTKYTFLKQENLDWGALFQIGWVKTESDYTCIDDLGEGYTEVDEGTSELSVYNMEIAVGPTWKAAEGLSIYGGPFFNLINGDIDDSGTWTEYDGETVDDSGTYTDSADVKQDSSFGGFVGAQWDFAQNASLFGEFQLTGAGWTFGTGVGWKF